MIIADSLIGTKIKIQRSKSIQMVNFLPSRHRGEKADQASSKKHPLYSQDMCQLCNRHSPPQIRSHYNSTRPEENQRYSS